MPYNDPDATDPMTLTGVELLVDDPGAIREMTVCFVEEYVRLGFSESAIIQLFASGEFAGPTMAIQQLGHDAIHEIIQEQIRLRGPRGIRLPVDKTPDGAVSLPVMEQ